MIRFASGARSWRHCACAFPPLGKRLCRAQVPQPSQTTPLLTTLINDLAAAGEEIVFILDEYYVIKSRVSTPHFSSLLSMRPPICI